jgi:hypothetical protein
MIGKRLKPDTDSAAGKDGKNMSKNNIPHYDYCVVNKTSEQCQAMSKWQDSMMVFQDLNSQQLPMTTIKQK